MEELEAVDVAVLGGPSRELELGVFGGYGEDVAEEGEGTWA